MNHYRMIPHHPLTMTTVGAIRSDVLAFTVGQDPQLDLLLVEDDCLGSAAHATMLARMRVPRRLFSAAALKRVLRELARIIHDARRGAFRITPADQDVHLAVERILTERLGDWGGRIHTGRSRNDQVAVDLRLFARRQLLDATDEVLAVASALLKLGARHRRTPMVGRTHLQPAMPSTVGLWAAAFAESLLDDADVLKAAYAWNDSCPLGAAAGYGTPLPIDRELTARLLGFRRPVHTVLHAIQARGKLEAAILHAMGQVMLTLSRLSTDLMLFSMPEFGYFVLPSGYSTGSSIMPQKRNPDVLELVRAKAAGVWANALTVAEIVRGLPGGYNRDLQETKAPFMHGIAETRACLRILAGLVAGIDVRAERLLAGFTPEVFATDQALDAVARGLPFRAAYRLVKEHPERVAARNPYRAVAARTHLGAPAGIDFACLRRRAGASAVFATGERRRCERTLSKLLGTPYTYHGG